MNCLAARHCYPGHFPCREALVVRCPLGRLPVLDGSWTLGLAMPPGRENDERDQRQIKSPSRFFQLSPRFLGSPRAYLVVSSTKAEAQDSPWRRCHGTDLSAVGFPLARCLGSFESQHPLCCGTLDDWMSFWLPPSAPWSLDPGVRRENENNPPPRCPLSFPPRKRGPRNRGGTAATKRTSAQRTFRWQAFWFMPLSFPPRKRGPRNRGGAAATRRTSAQLAFGQCGVRVLSKKQRPPRRGALGSSMCFWLAPSAWWSLDPGVRREDDEGAGRQREIGAGNGFCSGH